MLSYLIVGVVCLVAGGAITAIYYKNIMSKYGAVTTAAEAIKKAV